MSYLITKTKPANGQANYYIWGGEKHGRENKRNTPKAIKTTFRVFSQWVAREFASCDNSNGWGY